jgi:tRNA pseudouridine38-40 synthase
VFNYKITLEYNGKDFQGSQAQNGSEKIRTVQSELESSLANFLDEEIETNFAGRTDAGVHAVGQVANFKLNQELKELESNPDKLLISINSFLPQDMVISKIENVPLDFHARFSAKAREYSYKIFVRRHRPVLRLDSLMWHKGPLDFEKMSARAEKYLGNHDFKDFAKTEDEENTFCNIMESSLIKESEICFKYKIKADRFLRHMVRRIVGELIQIGSGNSTSQPLSLKTAPPEGLTLVKVYY